MPLHVDIYYSFRSPYCYLLTARLKALDARPDAAVALRPVYPIAIRDANFFKHVDPLRRPYHVLDSQRAADQLGISYRRPVPDPIVQDMETNAISPDQPYIYRLTRLAQAAALKGRGLAFADEIMSLIWNGATDDWHEGGHLAQAMARAGLDAPELERAASEEPERLDALIEESQTAQRAAGHWGVPLMVFDGEPFYGQDHFDTLVWRMQQKGLREDT